MQHSLNQTPPRGLRVLCGVAALAAVISTAHAAGATAVIGVLPFTASQAIDLTHAMHDDMVFWPGGVPFKKERLVDYDTGGYQLHKFIMGENTGTHVDAPSHFIKGNRSIDQLAIDQLIVPLVVFDAKRAAAADNDYELTPADIENWEDENGAVPANALFVMNTGWHNRFDQPQRYINMDDAGVMHFPGFSAAAAELLVARNVAGIGIDTLSIDHGSSTTFAAHVVMLAANKYQVENMAALDALPATGATAVIGVLPVRDGSQAQAQIFALLP
ncbi:cyclase family protein [Candidatus Spongiihabitans sp.]|uniref:cyclase family protein n=1 Tax=Candidatus Spongiihabitans sp. TaxID=3101308 RepID=UPI003C7A8CA6